MTVTYPELGSSTVGEAMTAGVLTCLPVTPLRTVARMMARHRVHAIVVFGSDDRLHPWGVVSDLDLVQAAATGELEDRTAGGTAVTPALTIGADDTLQRAAQMMSEHEVTHLVVVDRGSTQPVGVLSTLDLARTLA